MLLGFKKEFAEPIKLGTKIHTIRNPRKHQPKPGERLYMYHGLRTSHATLISNEHRLKSIQSIKMEFDLVLGPKKRIWIHNYDVLIDGKSITRYTISRLSINDGFFDKDTFLTFFIESHLKGKMNANHHPGTVTQYITMDLDLYHWTDLKY